MKQILFVLAGFMLALNGIAQTLEDDRLALIALYNSTNGAGWTNKTGWNVPGTVGDNPCGWYGVICNTPSGGSTRVYSLNLNGNNLTGTLPVEIGSLTELTDLRLRNNQITSIPSTIGNLKKVYIMLLDNNSLSGSIPPEIGDMTGLKQLGLNGNSLSGTIPDNLYNLALIESIDLNNNQLTGTISPLINNHAHLEWFGIANNKLSGTFPLINGGSLPVLRSIEMYGNFYTFDTFEENSAVASKINFNYQNCISITASGNTLSVASPGGTLSSEIFEWYDFNRGALVATLTGSTSFTPSYSSTYYVIVSNPLLKDFTNKAYQLKGCNIKYTAPSCSYCSYIKISFDVCGSTQSYAIAKIGVNSNDGSPIYQSDFSSAALSCACSGGTPISLYLSLANYNAWELYIKCGGTFSLLGKVSIPIPPTQLSFCTPIAGSYSGGTLPAFTNISVDATSICTALPVRWLSTKATLNTNKTISVNWETADEVQNKGFEVERSQNAKNFERINTTPPLGAGGLYQFIDIEPLLGVSYYRIKQLDNDGSFSYSRIVSVVNDTGIGSFPNPTTDKLTITMPQGLTGSAQLTDINGRSLKQMLLQQSLQTLKLDNMTTGTYFLTIYDDRNQILKMQKVVKQ